MGIEAQRSKLRGMRSLNTFKGVKDIVKGFISTFQSLHFKLPLQGIGLGYIRQPFGLQKDENNEHCLR